MPVHSREMGVSGECDVVEFHKVKDGISIAGREGSYSVIPVEYKRGKPKTDDSDILQVAAQALCLEEMLCCVIPYGYIYYGETRRRTKVEFTDEVKLVHGLMKDALCARLRSQKAKWFTCIPLLSQTWIPHRNALSNFTAKEV